MIILDNTLLKDIYGEIAYQEMNKQPNTLRNLIANDLKNALKTGKISKVFFEQLLQLHDTGLTSTYKYIIEEINCLENNELNCHKHIQTKKEGIFKGKELKGLYKKHFFIPSYHAKYNFNKTMNPSNETLKQNINAQLSQASNITDAICKTSNLIMDEYKQHKKTGDWIIYAKNGGIIYYLCIAKHSSKRINGISVDDKEIKKLCLLCIEQFPFLKTILLSNA